MIPIAFKWERRVVECLFFLKNWKKIKRLHVSEGHWETLFLHALDNFVARDPKLFFIHLKRIYKIDMRISGRDIRKLKPFYFAKQPLEPFCQGEPLAQ